MRAQVTFTPTESKKIIARAMATMDPVKKARENGMVVIHPSSTTLFLLEELTGKRPEGVWVCGVVLPKGMCLSREVQESEFHGRLAEGERSDLGQFPFSWVLENGEYRIGLPLASLLAALAAWAMGVGISFSRPMGRRIAKPFRLEAAITFPMVPAPALA